ncbi:MAG: hypothetical protein COX41_00830, partial [Candidatus Omnitrophica bacterium CG23_combo_of_CG06-09_8_20_14_all_41_10]
NVKVVVSDGEFSVDHSWILTVNPNSPPAIDSYSPLADPTITEEQTQIFTVATSDPDGHTLTTMWYLNGTLVATGASYTFVANYTSSGFYNVKVTVSDGELFVNHTWILTVTNVNRAPDIVSYSPTQNPTITEEQSQLFSVVASDPDKDSITIRWYLNNSLITTGGSYTFIANYTSAGWYNVKVVVSDGELSAEHSWILTVTNVNRYPIIDSCSPSTNPMITEEETQVFTVSASDPDYDQLTISWYLNESLVTTGDSYTFVADYNSAGWYEVKVVVSDGELSVNHIWILSVADVNRVPIVISITANPTTVNTGGTATITVDASDEDTGDVLTYVYSCTGGTISGTGNTVTWTAPNTAGDYTITVYVNDGMVNSN